MDFHNMYMFNLAMLAKQGWRLLRNSESLATQILKAKYYPYREFFVLLLEVTRATLVEVFVPQ